MPSVITEFNTFYAIISTAGAVFATTMAALVACYNELRETPALLLRPKSPKMGKRILLERIEFIWSRLKFTQKVTARNLFRYKKRFFMTIVGISGCTALLIAGFGLKDSIVSIAVKQFDEIYIKVEDDKKAKVKIAGITENYSFHYIYMSPHLYEKVFEKDVEFQKILAKTTGTDKAFEDKISKEILKYGDVSSINFITGISKSFKDMIGSLNYVVLVLIFSAGALAFVVLYNLTNINISERIREIATIKVLGFYDEEVSKYVYRENAILTIIGTAVGLVLGVFLHKFIILTGETEFIMFGRKIRFVSFVYSAILTIFFSLLVNFVMYFKLKKIDMVESLKSID